MKVIKHIFQRMLGEPAIKEYGNKKMPKGRKEYLKDVKYYCNA